LLLLFYHYCLPLVKEVLVFGKKNHQTSSNQNSPRLYKNPRMIEENKGGIEMARDQIKKHIDQMTEEEVHYLTQECKWCATQPMTFTKHAHRRRIRFYERDVRHCLKRIGRHSDLIEYNEVWVDGTCIDRRVLLRQAKHYYQTKNKKVHVCFVYSIDNKRIITMYTNDVNDQHDTLDWSNYDASLFIIK